MKILTIIELHGLIADVRGIRHFVWVASTYHGNHIVQQQYVPSYSAQQIQSNLKNTINIDMKLNLKKGADMNKDRKQKTSPWKAFINLSAAA